MAQSWFTMPFGKHKGEDIEDLDDNYLNWLMEQEWFIEKYPSGAKAVESELAFREEWLLIGDIPPDENWNRR